MGLESGDEIMAVHAHPVHSSYVSGFENFLRKDRDSPAWSVPSLPACGPRRLNRAEAAGGRDGASSV